MFVREPVEVETRQGHDDVEKPVLEGDEVAGGKVEGEFAFVVGGPEGVEECRGDGEEGDVLDVGVTVRMAGRSAEATGMKCA